MNIQVNAGVDFNAIDRDYEAKLKRGIAVATNQFRTRSNEFVRRDTGFLMESSFRASDIEHGLIVWDTPYAERVYLNDPATTINKDKNPNASDKWVDVARSRYEGEITRLIEQELGA